jgi:hypothetical protein
MIVENGNNFSNIWKLDKKKKKKHAFRYSDAVELVCNVDFYSG